MMHSNRTMKSAAAALAASALWAAHAVAQAPAPAPAQARPAPTPSSPTPGPTAAQARELGRQIQNAPTPLDSPQDFRDAARLLFMVADGDRNGAISKEEATDAANIAVGGLFFAADGDGDGTVTQEDAKNIREKIANRQPLLRILVQEARREGTSPGSPFRGVADLLDVNNDKQLQAGEVRSAISTAVEGLYAVADTNRDGQMSPDEVNAAAIGLAQAAGDAAFQLADADKNGAISQDEFQKALLEPANVIFGSIDANKDGQVTADEARQAQAVLMNQLMPRVPTAGGAAPVPNITPGQLIPGQPAPAGQPAATPAPR